MYDILLYNPDDFDRLRKNHKPRGCCSSSSPHPRWLWLRNNVSTAISQFFDTAIFYSIAFYGVIPNDQLPLIVLGTYLVKLVITVVDTPVVYLVVRWITGSWSAPAEDGGKPPGS